MLQAGIQANKQSYSAVISAFSKAGDTESAEKWLLQMLDMGIVGDTISYTAMINACARVGDVEKAERWLKRMIEDRIEPNFITFNALIAACAKTGQGHNAEAWLRKMKQAGVQPNSFSYNSVAKPFVAKGEYRKVEQIMTDLRSDGLAMDDFCLASLLHVYNNARPKQHHLAETASQVRRGEPGRQRKRPLRAGAGARPQRGEGPLRAVWAQAMSVHRAPSCSVLPACEDQDGVGRGLLHD